MVPQRTVGLVAFRVDHTSLEGGGREGGREGRDEWNWEKGHKKEEEWKGVTNGKGEMISNHRPYTTYSTQMYI